MVKILSQKSTDRMLGAHILGAVSIIKCAAVLALKGSLFSAAQLQSSCQVRSDACKKAEDLSLP